MFRSYNEFLIHSGNLLQILEIKSKTGLTSTEELLHAMRIAIAKGLKVSEEKIMEVYHFTPPDDFNEKELLTSVKIFLKTPTCETLHFAINTVKAILHNINIDSLIIWYPTEMKEEPTEELLDLWKVLEEYVAKKKVGMLGIADIETKVFASLYEKVKVKPEIFHLNVERCCSVPPDLQKFAEEKEIQLLTHYDPPDILPQQSVLDDIKDFSPNWIARYHSHIRCRGVLVKKGYLAYFRQV